MVPVRQKSRQAIGGSMDVRDGKTARSGALGGPAPGRKQETQIFDEALSAHHPRSLTFRPRAVSRYCWSRLFGLSGRVSSTRPASKAGWR